MRCSSTSLSSRLPAGSSSSLILLPGLLASLTTLTVYLTVLVFTSPLTHALIPFSPSPQAGSAKSPSHTGLSQLYLFGFPSSGETSPNRLTVPLPLETHHTPDTRPDQTNLASCQPASHSVCLSVSLLPTYPLPPLLFFPFPNLQQPANPTQCSECT
ncbi:hypothetical protein K456DRAFT_1184168 [Colletotrichum gloeosporioides 23]|nr:hypothetical protein K456DRAFT_1184168 [Colletotrichum gloeosporioides 23]